MSRSVRSRLQVEQRRKLLEQCARRLRVRRRRDVVRHRRPDRRRREVEPAHRVVQHADDAGRALVPRPLHAEPGREHVVGGGTGAADRPGVRRVAEQARRASRRSRSRSVRATLTTSSQNVRHAGSARCRATARDRVPAPGPSRRERQRGPLDRRAAHRRPARPSVAPPGSRGTPRRRATRTASRRTSRASHRTASVAASPASFHPWNAAISAGRCSSERRVVGSSAPTNGHVRPYAELRTPGCARPGFAACRAPRS